MYLYAAQAVRTVDGDTLIASLDLGFNIHMQVSIRLLGINCPEHGTPEGDAATAFTAAWLAANHDNLTVRTILDKREKYGRLLGVVMSGAHTLNDDLVTAGHAVPYDGGKRTLPSEQGEPAAPTPVP
ncbi:thermonuclease family protein [Streptomyces collinus]|uniref:thermonuclease family protein n=1 Tax=Streptomyces collinus TaxID=42684 RepID=UPI0033A0E673